VGFVVDKVALGQVFSEYFCFACQFSFHRLLHTHRLSFGAGTVGQIVADVPSELSLTPPQEIRKKKFTLSPVCAEDVSRRNFSSRKALDSYSDRISYQLPAIPIVRMIFLRVSRTWIVLRSGPRLPLFKSWPTP
jgi:hypothetical protein